MQAILEETAGRRTVIVHGLGGIGKTQLSLAYIKRNRGVYTAMIWLDSRDETALKQSFARTAELILRHHPSTTYIASALDSRDLREIVKAVKRWFDGPTNDQWLIVYDNYDSPLFDDGRAKDSRAKDAGQTSSVNIGSYSDEADNFSRAFDIRSYLPETDHGAIIVTTRSSMVNLGQPIFLGKLTDINDSLEILASGSRREGLKIGEYL